MIISIIQKRDKPPKLQAVLLYPCSGLKNVILKYWFVRNVFETIYESCYALFEGILRDMDIYTERVTDYKKRKIGFSMGRVHQPRLGMLQ